MAKIRDVKKSQGQDVEVKATPAPVIDKTIEFTAIVKPVFTIKNALPNRLEIVGLSIEGHGDMELSEEQFNDATVQHALVTGCITRVDK